MSAGRVHCAGSTARESARRLPAGPGVYRFRDEGGRILYLGRAVNLRRRVTSYWRDLGDRPHLAGMVARVARIQAIECDSEHEAAWLERNLMERRLPQWNKTPGGQESEVWIRLDRSGRLPGVTVVHVPATARAASCFGPYLGGGRVRLAVAGLLRARPLHYAADSPGGTARELASFRGVGPADRDRLAESALAVLARDPAAVASVAADLADRRAAAAQAQAYEVAAQIQGELTALHWITCPQRVTAATAENAVASGWADGILIRLGIEDGRMCTWRQSAASPDAAERWLAATPPGWRDFADRNASLAARLAG